jgi:hypothetical protein
MADDTRSGSDVEKGLTDVLNDLARDRIGKGAAEQLKGAAEQSIKRQTRDGSLNGAISGRR